MILFYFIFLAERTREHRLKRASTLLPSCVYYSKLRGMNCDPPRFVSHKSLACHSTLQESHQCVFFFFLETQPQCLCFCNNVSQAHRRTQVPSCYSGMPPPPPPFNAGSKRCNKMNVLAVNFQSRHERIWDVCATNCLHSLRATFRALGRDKRFKSESSTSGWWVILKPWVD